MCLVYTIDPDTISQHAQDVKFAAVLVGRDSPDFGDDAGFTIEDVEIGSD